VVRSQVLAQACCAMSCTLVAWLEKFLCTPVHSGCAFLGWVAGDVSLMTSIYLSVLARAADSYKLRLHVLHDLAWVESSLV
jgi:uncharacterized membrane protein (DUF485 family)